MFVVCFSSLYCFVVVGWLRVVFVVVSLLFASLLIRRCWLYCCFVVVCWLVASLLFVAVPCCLLVLVSVCSLFNHRRSRSSAASVTLLSAPLAVRCDATAAAAALVLLLLLLLLVVVVVIVGVIVIFVIVVIVVVVAAAAHDYVGDDATIVDAIILYHPQKC